MLRVKIGDRIEFFSWDEKKWIHHINVTNANLLQAAIGVIQNPGRRIYRLVRNGSILGRTR